jgi:hypothetical protein
MPDATYWCVELSVEYLCRTLTLLRSVLGRRLSVCICHVCRGESLLLRRVVVVKARGMAMCGVRNDCELLKHESQTYIDLGIGLVSAREAIVVSLELDVW